MSLGDFEFFGMSTFLDLWPDAGTALTGIKRQIVSIRHLSHHCEILWPASPFSECHWVTLSSSACPRGVVDLWIYGLSRRWHRID
ncbi:hypothetical protein TNCV_4980911 [Trichonephila clavipes]|nr:hypothetical protein TNCV_4980911 [Trichonephila clavipes]